MARVFVLDGVNLGALGTRRPEVNGTSTLGYMKENLHERFPGVDFEFRQTDYEGEMVGFVRAGRGLWTGRNLNVKSMDAAIS